MSAHDHETGQALAYARIIDAARHRLIRASSRITSSLPSKALPLSAKVRCIKKLASQSIPLALHDHNDTCAISIADRMKRKSVVDSELLASLSDGRRVRIPSCCAKHAVRASTARCVKRQRRSRSKASGRHGRECTYAEWRPRGSRVLPLKTLLRTTSITTSSKRHHARMAIEA